MNIQEIPTPAVLLENSRLNANLDRMQLLADANNVTLRPHTKTHKSIELARKQIGRGAKGITVAKVGEAEIFAEAGFDDIYLAYTVIGTDKYERLIRLMDTARISFNVDGFDGLRMVREFFGDSGKEIDIIVEVDAGYHRCGLPWDSDEIVELVRATSVSKGIRFKGIMTHAGNSYYGPADESETKDEALTRVSNEERDRMIALADRLAGVGLTPEVVSIGSTPSISHFSNKVSAKGQTIIEIRPGNYIFNDAIQVALGVAKLDQCSLTVLTTVISVQEDSNGRERLFLDAGKKVFTSDTGYDTNGYGTLLYNARTMTVLPHAELHALSEEHGWVRVSGGATFAVGDRVRVVPNHACVVMNTQRKVYVVDGFDVIDEITVDAQGKLV